jgi:transposase
MTARTPQLRKKTAKEVAAKLGVSARTVRRYVAAPREWWKEHRREIREKAATLRDTGMTWKQVGETLGVTEGSARALAKRARGQWTPSNLMTKTKKLQSQGKFENP